MKLSVGLLLVMGFISMIWADDCDDNQAMPNFVGGVYRDEGFAVGTDKNTALVKRKLILRKGDVLTTLKGVYSSNRGIYSSRNGIVVQNVDVFSGKEGTVVGSGCLDFGKGSQTIVSTGTSSTIRKP